MSYVVGHSYGAWLTYDSLTLRAQAGDPPAVLVAIAKDRVIARERNFQMELFAAKQSRPKEYLDFFLGLPDIASCEAWRLKDLLREHLGFSQNRKLFYWANTVAMNEYMKIIDSIDLESSDDIFIQVRDSIYQDPVPKINLDNLPGGSRRIVGFQDWLTAEELPSAESEDPIVFLRSSHYPHIEQPRALIELLMTREFGEQET